MLKAPINTLFQTISRTLKFRAVIAVCCIAMIDFSIILGLLHLLDIYKPVQEQTATVIVLFVAIIELLASIFFYNYFRNRLSVLAVARKAEALHPEFNGAIICAVEKELVSADERTFFENLLVEDINDKIFKKEITVKSISEWLTVPKVVLTFLIAALATVGTINSRYFQKTINFLQASSGVIISPEKLQAPVDTDLTINASILRWEQEAEIEIKEDGKSVRYPMLKSDSGFLFTFYGVTEPISFRIVTPSLQSEFKTIDVFTPPTAENISIKLTPPEYCGMKPSKFDSLQDISALEGTLFEFSCQLIPTGTEAEIIFKDQPIKLNLVSGLHQMSLPITESGDYKLVLHDKAGRTVNSATFNIEMIPDLAPVVSIITPGKDSNVKVDEELKLSAVASDDFGVTKVKLHYSISGHNFEEEIFTSAPNERINDRSLKHAIETKGKNLRPGTVIKYYMSVEDNRNPEKLSSRSEIFFATIVEPKKKDDDQDQDGDGQQEQKKLSIYPLIAELKRTIRLTHDAQMYNDEDRSEAAAEIAKALADLRIKAVKILDEIKEAVGNPEEPIIKEFQKAVDEIKQAETSARAKLLDPSIPIQESAMNRLSVIATELAKNQKKKKSSGADGKCDKEDGEGKKGTKGQSDKKSLKATLSAMKKALQEVRRQSDRQGALNSDMRKYSGSKIPASERKQLGERQSEIRQKVQEINEAIKSLPQLESVNQQLEQATKEESQAITNLKMGNSSPALRSGVKSHNELLSAAAELSTQINSLISNEVKAMAKAAKALSEQQSKAAENSKGLAGKSSEATQQAKTSQGQLKKYSDRLQDAVREMSSQVDELHPELAEALRKTLSDLQKERLDSNMKKGENSLNYRRFDKAAKYQKKAASTLQKMGKSLDSSRDLLPGLSHDRLVQSLQKLEQMKDQVREISKNSNTEGMKQLKDQLSKELGELGRGMKNPQMTQLQTTSELLPQATKANIKPLAATAYQIINDATSLIRNQLMKMELDSIIELNRKTSKPPEKYRKQIEDYFKMLSE